MKTKVIIYVYGIKVLYPKFTDQIDLIDKELNKVFGKDHIIKIIALASYMPKDEYLFLSNEDEDFSKKEGRKEYFLAKEKVKKIIIGAFIFLKFGKITFINGGEFKEVFEYELISEKPKEKPKEKIKKQKKVKEKTA
ncbi:MAG: hypothetical protein NT068_02585 [Candidatus Nomurabacteria bacterium]|nr:hypothetical protein [Candidatus Nomurabacteria bacterium]